MFELLLLVPWTSTLVCILIAQQWQFDEQTPRNRAIFTMKRSEEDEDYSSHEAMIPHLTINSLYQSNTERFSLFLWDLFVKS